MYSKLSRVRVQDLLVAFVTSRWVVFETRFVCLFVHNSGVADVKNRI